MESSYSNRDFNSHRTESSVTNAEPIRPETTPKTPTQRPINQLVSLQGRTRQYKMSKTTIRVYLPANTTKAYVLFKLHTVTTSEMLFAKVAHIIGMDLEEMNMLSVRFDEESSDKGVLVLRKDLKDTFDCFVDMVEKDNCWENDGYLQVIIEACLVA
ncbi:MAG: hypothetical protein Q9219_005567 [cf. Caloplaca sp. 3 TL-2023]